jgi:hypothetical protein
VLLASICNGVSFLKDIISTLAAGIGDSQFAALPPLKFHKSSAGYVPVDAFLTVSANSLSRGLKWCHLSWPSILGRCSQLASNSSERECGFLVIESSSEDVILSNESINKSRTIKWTKLQCDCSKTTTLQLQSSLSLSREVILNFCESLRWIPKKRIFLVCRQMIIPMKLSSAQHRS